MEKRIFRFLTVPKWLSNEKKNENGFCLVYDIDPKWSVCAIRKCKQNQAVPLDGIYKKKHQSLSRLKRLFDLSVSNFSFIKILAFSVRSTSFFNSVHSAIHLKNWSLIFYESICVERTLCQTQKFLARPGFSSFSYTNVKCVK